jgi:long-chain acyl-CoA synthetase
MTRSLADAFDANAARTPLHTAVREAGRDVSYADLRARSDAVSRTLSGLGVGPGARVGLMLPNSAAFVAGFFGIARLGGVVAPLNVRYRTQELVYYLEDTRATALVVPPDLAGVAREAFAGMGRAPALIEIDDEGGCRVAGGGSDPSALPRATAPVARGEVPADDTPLMHQYTSGSTGNPKRVVRSHQQLVVELDALATTFTLGPEDRFLGAAPFTHVNGLVRTMLASMIVGGTLHPLRRFDRRGALALISGERITYFGGVPTMFVLLADTPARGEVDLSSLRIVFSASAPLLPADNRRFLEAYGHTVRQLYGSTETGTISVNLHDDPARCCESVGRPLPGVRLDVVDDRGRSLPTGEEGEVVIASPGAILGYEGNPEANAASFRAGFYLSGDLGRFNPDGCLVLTGRKKFLINRGGFKVNPLEVEEAIQSHPLVTEVAVYGAPGPHGDDLVRCAVVTSGPCTEREILDHCRGRIADFKIPSHIEFRDTLPRTETGKILRQKLRDPGRE